MIVKPFSRLDFLILTTMVSSPKLGDGPLSLQCFFSTSNWNWLVRLLVPQFGRAKFVKMPISVLCYMVDIYPEYSCG